MQKGVMSFRYKYNRRLVPFSKANREGQTDAEKLLWSHLRNRQLKGYKFRRQYPIDNYIIDFYCSENSLAIELDGGQHIQRVHYDQERTKRLQKHGIQIIRFWDNEVLQNINGVLEQILVNLTLPSPDRRGDNTIGPYDEGLGKK